MNEERTVSPASAARKCPFAPGEPMRFPQARQTPFDPPHQYQEGEPIRIVQQWNGRPAWLVTRYADARKLLLDPRMSSDASNPRYPAQNAALQFVRAAYQNFAQMDPPSHTEERKMFASEFSVRRIEEIKPVLQGIIDGLIAKMKLKQGHADLVADYAMPMPLTTIGTLLGVPEKDHPLLHEVSRKTSAPSTTREQAVEMMKEFEQYLNALIDWKDANPGDDVLSRLIVAQLRTGNIDRHKVVSMARVLLIAGHKSTTSTLSVGLAALLYHPEQLRKLQNDIALIDSAIEEILRFVDVTHSGRLRVAKEDIDIDGVHIKAGDAIIMHQPTANRDPEVFANPYDFEITRNPKNHLAFGSGIHQCLGHPLARAELRLGLKAIIENFPAIEPAVPLESLNFQHHLAIYGLESLPVNF